MDVRWAGILGANFTMLWVFTVCDQGQSWEELETVRDGAGAALGVVALGRVITIVVMRAMTVALHGANFVPGAQNIKTKHEVSGLCGKKFFEVSILLRNIFEISNSL